MSDFALEFAPLTPTPFDVVQDSLEHQLVSFFGLMFIPPTPVSTKSFKMRALASPGPGYVTWVVPTTPDFAGAHAPSPIQPGTAIITDSWEA
jgi:hypothetical protein